MSDKKKPKRLVWFVRGVPVELRDEVAAAAERAGMNIGPWVVRALRAALERQEGQGAPSGPGGAGDDLRGLVTVLAAQMSEMAERVERLEMAQTVPAIPGLASRDGDGGRGRVPPAIPSPPAPDNVKPRRTGVGRGVGGGKRLTDEQNRLIADMLKAGRPYSEIAPIVGVSIGGLTKIKKRLADQGLLTETEMGPGLGAGEAELTTAQLLQTADEAEQTLRPIEEIQRVTEMQKDGRPDVEIAAFLKGEPEEPEGQGS